ncbi:MAG: hypothetical protein JSV00_04910 [bacterium]|nr:MAG: hypothetical protein JSV00_04910 [bacterium]
MTRSENRKTGFAGCCGQDFKAPEGRDAQMSRIMEMCCGQDGSFDCSRMMEMFRGEDGSFDVSRMMEMMKAMTEK